MLNITVSIDCSIHFYIEQNLMLNITTCLTLLLLWGAIATGVFSTFRYEFCWSRAKGILGRDLKFAGFVHHYKILTGNIFGLILKIKMAAMGVSLSVLKSAYISLIIGPRRLVCKANL